VREFRRKGLASMDPAAYPEREGKLTRDQETSLRAALRDSPPARHERGPGHHPAAAWRRVIPPAAR